MSPRPGSRSASAAGTARTPRESPCRANPPVRLHGPGGTIRPDLRTEVNDVIRPWWRIREWNRVLAFAVAVGAACLPRAPVAVGDCVPEEPSGYRMSEFREPVPCTLAGATVVSTEALQLRIERDAPLLVDVLPSPRRPEGVAEGTPWLPPSRRNIPGTVWLPNTGFGELPIEEETYLRANLERLTGGDSSRPLVFYCLAQCWMSWNAARRAVEWGYDSVIWYPDGTDGWEAAGLPLAESSPVSRGAGE